MKISKTHLEKSGLHLFLAFQIFYTAPNVGITIFHTFPSDQVFLITAEQQHAAIQYMNSANIIYKFHLISIPYT